MSVDEPARRFETFSYLPPLSEDELVAQIEHLLRAGYVPAIEHTATPGPRELYWSLWKLPLFEASSAGEVLAEIDACAALHPSSYVRLIGYDPRRQGQVLSLVARRP